MNRLQACPISRAAVIRAMDQAYIEGLGLPSAVLMDEAGRGCADVLRRRHPTGRFVVLCGPGNNGGDGYVIVRHLATRGREAVAVAAYPARTPEAGIHRRVAEAMGLVVGLEALPGVLAGEGTVVIDALFGTGQRAPMVLPPMPGLTESLAAGAPLVAIDVPTGVDADTGERVGEFAEAGFVVTIGRRKPFLFRAAIPYVLVDIGLEVATALHPPGVPAWPPEAVLVTDHRVRGFGAADQKWSRGHVAVLAGSPEKAGAGVLVCLGALRAGAGLVTLHTPREGWARLGALPPEVMVEDLAVREDRFAPEPLRRADALVVGPGLGRGVDGAVRALWAEEPRPVVFDADALRIIAGSAPSAHPRLLTPHAGEAAALLGIPAPDADRFATARALRALAPTIYKGACSVVTGDVLQVLPGGLPQLGTAGSGDVLAGIAGALLARAGAEGPVDAGAVERLALDAAWLHQEAGRRAGGPGVRASEIADSVPAVRDELARRAADGGRA